jgi:hypothetical protein
MMPRSYARRSQTKINIAAFYHLFMSSLSQALDRDPSQSVHAKGERELAAVVQVMLKGWPLLLVHCVDDAFDLLDVLPFMASQPLRIKQHGPLEYLSRPRNSRRT